MYDTSILDGGEGGALPEGQSQKPYQPGATPQAGPSLHGGGMTAQPILAPGAELQGYDPSALGLGGAQRMTPDNPALQNGSGPLPIAPQQGPTDQGGGWGSPYAGMMTDAGGLGSDLAAVATGAQTLVGQPGATPYSGNAGSASGLPTPSQVGATAPAPLQAFGALPQVTPTYGTAAQVGNPNAPSAAMMNPALAQAPGAPNAATGSAALVNPAQNQQYLDQYAKLTEQALAPGYQKQQMQLEDQNRARGISNSGAAGYLSSNLLGQQAAGTAAAIAPMVQQEASYTQADVAANQANRQSTNQSNTAAINSFMAQGYSYQQASSMANQSNRQQANQTNTAAINALMAQGYSYQEANMLANQQSQNAMTSQNVGVANAASGTNAGYYNEALTGNATSYNNYLAQLYGTGASTANSEMAAYLNSFGPNSGVTSMMNTGLSGTQNAYSNVYGQALQGQGQALNGLGSAFGASAGG